MEVSGCGLNLSAQEFLLERGSAQVLSLQLEISGVAPKEEWIMCTAHCRNLVAATVTALLLVACSKQPEDSNTPAPARIDEVQTKDAAVPPMTQPANASTQPVPPTSGLEAVENLLNSRFDHKYPLKSHDSYPLRAGGLNEVWAYSWNRGPYSWFSVEVTHRPDDSIDYGLNFNEDGGAATFDSEVEAVVRAVLLRIDDQAPMDEALAWLVGQARTKRGSLGEAPKKTFGSLTLQASLVADDLMIGVE